MGKLILCTRRDDLVLQGNEDAEVLAVEELNIGKCRGCMRCKVLKHCISYNDDAQKCIPLITGADSLEVYLQPGSNVQLLLNRVLYALAGNGRPFSFRGEDKTEEEYLRRLLTWAGYTEET